jgi:phosphatidylglycerol lysyltransferase
VAHEWARLRHGDARGFCVGRFDPPRLRREWLAVAWDPARHRIEAFAAWVPIPARRGWALDVVRRRADARVGALDLLIVSAIDHARARGDQMLSLALAPLAFVPGAAAHGSGSNATPRLHEADGARIVLQQHLTRLYDPANATAWKRRFDPSFEDRYLVVPEPAVLPDIVQALVHAQTLEDPEALRTPIARAPDRGENEA